MCLTTKRISSKVSKKDLQERHVKTAGRNITVYKILYFFKDSLVRYKSPYQYTPYQQDKTYTSKLTTYTNGHALVVKMGLHAWRTIKAAKKVAYCDRVIAVMTIPKGAKYVLGNKGDIVSTKLIWNKGLLKAKPKKLQ